VKAALIHGYGQPDVFRIEDVPAPVCGPRDVLVDVRAAGINPIDYKIRSGGQRAVIWLSFPAVLGLDVSGVVAQVGDQVTRFAVGDEVFASPSHRRMGTYAEQIAVRESELARKPSRLSHAQAAALPLVGLTAWDSLMGACKLQAGERVLIQAGSGGVGTIAIQLAKHVGAEVFTTCSPRNHELVAGLGADHVIDYRTQDWAVEAADVDVILESIGGDDLERAIGAVKRGGRIASIAAGLPQYTKRFGPALGLTAMISATLWRMVRARATRGVKLSMVTRRASGANLQQLAAIVDAGDMTPVVDRVFALDDVAEAHRYLETSRARGKVVLAVGEAAKNGE